MGKFYGNRQSRSGPKSDGGLSWLDAKGATKRLMIGSTSKRSLTSNPIQHKRVMEIGEPQRGIKLEDFQVKLEEIINSVKKDIPLGVSLE